MNVECGIRNVELGERPETWNEFDSEFRIPHSELGNPRCHLLQRT